MRTLLTTLSFVIGKTITPLKNTILLCHYKDGTIEKKIIIE